MSARTMLILAALAALAACDRIQPPQDAVSEAPQLEAPAPESEPTLSFAPQNDAARGATGPLSVTRALRMPDASDLAAAPRDVLTLRGENGLIVEAEVSGAITPATQIEGQTLRALLGLDVDAAQVLVYRVVSETKPQSGQGLCGANAPAFVAVWEPDGPGDALKLLGITGAAPGEAAARACTLLDYRRA